MKTVEQILDEWAKSTAMPMDDFFVEPETQYYRDWKHIAGCYRIIEDSNPTDTTVTLYVGEAFHLYRVYAHYYFRQAWVQMVEAVDELVDELSYSSHKQQGDFRRTVEKAGAKRFKPVYGPSHGGRKIPPGWRWQRPS